METISLIDDASTAHVALSPIRRRILAALSDPASASEVAERLGLTRQRIGYHLHLLEEHGLIRVVEERPKRGFIERRYQLVGDPAIAPDLASPKRSVPRDDWAAEAAIAAASDVVRAVGTLSAAAAADGAALVMATGTAEVTFARPSDLASFLEEFGALAARYDGGAGGEGARHTVTLISHPIMERKDDER